jgi:hypothetical protein
MRKIVLFLIAIFIMNHSYSATNENCLKIEKRLKNAKPKLKNKSKLPKISSEQISKIKKSKKSLCVLHNYDPNNYGMCRGGETSKTYTVFYICETGVVLGWYVDGY